MVLGAATAPWLTIGFVLAVWATRRSTSLKSGGGLGVSTTAVYLFVWLATYHATFAIRESVTQAAAWREAAPWLLLAGPAVLVLGVAAAAAHKSGIMGDVSLALPIAWSMPEITANLRPGWSYTAIVAIPTAALALLPLVAVDRREVRLVRLVVAWALLGVTGLELLPVLRSLIHS